MEIEVWEYIRTTDGEIHKIKSIEGNFIEFENCYGISVREKYYIVNHSKNIIDLIEVGDYVNGIEVIGFYKGVFREGIELANHYKISYTEFVKIKSIVTKEMMKSVEYRIN